MFPLLTRSILLTLTWIKPFSLLYFRCWKMLDKIRVEGTDTKLMGSTVTCHLNTALNQLLFYVSRSLFLNIDHPLQNTHSLLLPFFSGDTFFSIQEKKKQKRACRDRCTPCWIISPSMPMYLSLFYHLLSFKAWDISSYISLVVLISSVLVLVQLFSVFSVYHTSKYRYGWVLHPERPS